MYGKLSLAEIWKMPTIMRQWWFDRLREEESKKKGG